MPKRLVIAVSNRKGGTGKTTTTVNLAAQWALSGHNTLVVDLDTQGHTSIGFGVKQHRGFIHDIFNNPDLSLNTLVSSTLIDKVKIIGADTRFTGLGVDFDIQLLRQKIEALADEQQFTRIVIDTPPTLDAMLMSALTAANGVIIPFIPHHLAEIGVSQLAQLFYSIATAENAELKLLGLLPIMLDKNIRIHRRVLDNLTKQYGTGRILRGIRSNIKLAEAFEDGMPIQLYAPKSRGAMDYHIMTDELERILC